MYKKQSISYINFPISDYQIPMKKKPFYCFMELQQQRNQVSLWTKTFHRFQTAPRKEKFPSPCSFSEFISQNKQSNSKLPNLTQLHHIGFISDLYFQLGLKAYWQKISGIANVAVIVQQLYSCASNLATTFCTKAIFGNCLGEDSGC